jgi:hypothetical protein
MRNAFLEAVMERRAEEQLAEVRWAARSKPGPSIGRIPARRNRDPRRPETRKRAGAREYYREQRRSLSDAWAALECNELLEARVRIAELAPAFARKLEVAWRLTGRTWPL